MAPRRTNKTPRGIPAYPCPHFSDALLCDLCSQERAEKARADHIKSIPEQRTEPAKREQSRHTAQGYFGAELASIRDFLCEDAKKKKSLVYDTSVVDTGNAQDNWWLRHYFALSDTDDSVVTWKADGRTLVPVERWGPYLRRAHCCDNVIDPASPSTIQHRGRDSILDALRVMGIHAPAKGILLEFAKSCPHCSATRKKPAPRPLRVDSDPGANSNRVSKTSSKVKEGAKAEKSSKGSPQRQASAPVLAPWEAALREHIGAYLAESLPAPASPLPSDTQACDNGSNPSSATNPSPQAPGPDHLTEFFSGNWAEGWENLWLDTASAQPAEENFVPGHQPQQQASMPGWDMSQGNVLQPQQQPSTPGWDMSQGNVLQPEENCEAPQGQPQSASTQPQGALTQPQAGWEYLPGFWHAGEWIKGGWGRMDGDNICDWMEDPQDQPQPQASLNEASISSSATPPPGYKVPGLKGNQDPTLAPSPPPEEFNFEDFFNTSDFERDFGAST